VINAARGKGWPADTAVDSALVTSKNPAMLLLSPRSELSNTAGVGVPLSTGGPKLRTHDMDQHDECDRGEERLG
jgi:hypothetical protein